MKCNLSLDKVHKKVHKIILHNKQINNLSKDIFKIAYGLAIKETSYDLNNLDTDCEILIFSNLDKKIINLSPNINKIHLENDIFYYRIKLPFGCSIEYY